MAEVRTVVFGPGDKLAWLEAVARNISATDQDVRCAVAISNRIDKFKGTATISCAWLAQFIGRANRPGGARSGRMPGERSMQDSTARLRQLGLLDIAPGRGRFNVNTLRPLIDGSPKLHGQPWQFRNSSDTASRVTEDELTRLAAQSDTASRAKLHGWPCALPNTFPNLLPKGGGGGDDQRIRDTNEADWRYILSCLGNDLSADTLRAWFESVDIAHLDDAELLLIAPSKFHANYVQNHYGSRLLAAAGRLRPTVKLVRVHAASSLRAEK